MHIPRAMSVAAACLWLAACATTEVTDKSNAYPPLAPGADVAIFTAESQIKGPFELVAKISYMDPGKFAVLSLKDAFEPLKAKAREIGANGVIIDHSETLISGIISRGISVEARAIHLDMPPTQTAPQESPNDAAEELRQLKKLHDDGVINDTDYETKKAEILRRM